MIKALVIDNLIEGLRAGFNDNHLVQYDFWEVDGKHIPQLAPYDLLVAPNGTDQVAMWHYREAVADFLAAGKTLCCFDGWYTNWIPGHRWVMDNSKRTIDIRYAVGLDRYGLFDGVDVDQFTFSNGISGWWACGYIQPAPGADVVMHDTWGRAMMVLDEVSTPGRLFLTASGPLGDYPYATTDDDQALAGIVRFYQNLLEKWVAPGLAQLA